MGRVTTSRVRHSATPMGMRGHRCVVHRAAEVRVGIHGGLAQVFNREPELLLMPDLIVLAFP